MERDLEIKKAIFNVLTLNELETLLYDTIIDIFSIELKEKDDYEPIFLELPIYNIGLFVSWDANDTEVREGIYSYILENKEKYKKLIENL